MSEAKIKISATDDASKVLALVRSNMDQVQRSAVAVGNAIGLIGATGLTGLAVLVKNTIDSVDALNDLKDATGASIENISALEDIAARTGTSFDTVGTSLIKFNAQLKDAKPGSGAEQALTALGLSVKELQSLDPAEALLKTASALNDFADDGNKARLVQELFGKSIKEVAPFLKDLADKGKLVATVTTEQALAAEKFNQQLSQIQKNATDASRAIVGSLLPSINEGIERFRLAYKSAGGFLEALALYNRLDYGKDIQGNLDVVEQQISALEDRSKRITSDSVQRGNDKVLADLKNQAKYLKELRQLKILAEQGDNGDAISRKFRPKSVGVISTGSKAPGGVKPAKEVDDTNRSLTSYIENLQRIGDKTQQLTELQKAQEFLDNKGGGANAAQREFLLSIAAQVDKEKELIEVLKIKREASIADGDAVNAQNEAYQARLKTLLDATPTAIFEKQQTDIRQLVDEFEAGRISEQQYVEAITARLDLTNMKVEETKDLAKELGLSFTSAFEDAVVGGKGLSDVLRGLEQDIIRIVTRKLVTEPLGNAITGALGSLGSSSGSGLGSFISGLFRAEGGPVSGGQPYIVGERGPELIVPRSNGTVIPNNALGGGNTVIVNVNQSFAQGTNRSTVLQAAADARRQLELAGRNL